MSRLPLILALAALPLAACGPDDAATDLPADAPGSPLAEAPAPGAVPGFAPALEVDLDASTHTPSGLYYRDLTVGDGAEATAGQTVSAHYTGWLPDGTEFESSRPGGAPITFPLGVGAVIPGWDEGLQGMRVGGRRQLVIPPELGYGAGGSGPIPPNSTIVFEVELMGVE